VRRLLAVVTVAALFLQGACASIPQAAPELSAQLASRIQESRRAHIDAVRLYMDVRRQQADDFIAREWIPAFANDVLQQPAVASAFDEAARTSDLTLRLEVIVGLGTRLQRQINAKREELMRPLDEAELLITRRLDDHYNEVLAMNSTLTGLLAAGAEATETQARIARHLDPEGKLPEYLDVADELVRELLQRTEEVDEQQAKIDSLLSRLRRSQ
jgi:hypothetical protein